jgi:hypothetical protein
MSSPQIQLALWFTQPPLQAAIAILVYRRRLHKEFPAFFTYMAAQILIFCVQLPLFFYGGSELRFKLYWISAAVNLVLAFRIIHEIFLDVFKPYHALRDLGAALFRWAAIIMVLVSVVLISVVPSWENPLMNSILLVQRCVQVVQCGLVVFLLAFCTNLGVNWRRLSFGIALGFGFISASELLTTALYSGGRMQVPSVQFAVLVCYNIGMLVLLFYALINRRADLVPVLVPQRWDEALMEITPPAGEGDSLIPMFEHMVDQALSKAHDTRA